MKKTFKLMTVSALLIMCGCQSKPAETSGTYTPGEYSAAADGFGGKVTVTITTDAEKITHVQIEGADETPAIGGAALETLAASIMEKQSSEIDDVSGATFTSTAVKEAAEKAIAQAKGEETAAEESAELTFTAGTYTGTAEGYNGPVKLDVTFSDKAVTDIQISEEQETAHIGTPAYDIMFADAIAANGSGIDAVSGATFTSRAVKDALNDAASQAGVSSLDTFKSHTVGHSAGEDIDVTYDVVIVGAGGAGLSAAAECAMNGQTVLVIEENAEVGGNTLAAGGQFQAVMDYLCWDADDPEAVTAVWEYNGQTYDKVKAFRGEIATLKTILNWNEEPFDPHYFDDKEYVAGEIDELSNAGVHEEYLPTLQALKQEITAYLAYAEPKLASGMNEEDLTLFSTVNLHIFQTYYGGLRHSADGNEWIYGNFDLVSQMCSEAPGLKTWLEDQGSVILDSAQRTLVGAIWYRANRNQGCDLDGDGTMEISGNWGSYFAPLMNTITKTSETAADNKVMLRTTAESLIIEDGAVTGVNATMYDGTKVTAHGTNGVILATGGYAANVEKVVETNNYWDPEKVTEAIKTTNRSSLQGDGLAMAEEAGAAVTGLEYTQMMPISWIDNGNLAYGSGQYAVYINPTTGKRFVDEFAERDVLSLGEFANGITYNGVNGVFLEITNGNFAMGYPYHYDRYEGQTVVEVMHDEIENRVYFASNAEEMQRVLDIFGMEASPEDIYDTIRQYDEAYLNNTVPADGIKKSAQSVTVGTVKEDGSYALEGELLRIRVMAPSTHHTMGGLVVDTERHVLDENGEVIPGLYAAGEVTGGIHAGNRLGGNAITDVLLSGKIAAETIVSENN